MWNEIDSYCNKNSMLEDAVLACIYFFSILHYVFKLLLWIRQTHPGIQAATYISMPSRFLLKLVKIRTECVHETTNVYIGFVYVALHFWSYLYLYIKILTPYSTKRQGSVLQTSFQLFLVISDQKKKSD